MPNTLLGFWVAGAATALTLLGSPALAQDCTLKQVVSYDITDGPNGEIFVPITINGTDRLFLVDTGGVYTILNQGTIAEMGLTPQTVSGVEVYGFRGYRYTTGVTIDTLKIGPIESKYFKVLVGPGSGQQGNLKVAGILGPDILMNFDVEFDFAAKKMKLYSQDHCPGKVVHWAQNFAEVSFDIKDGTRIQFPMTLDGTDFQVMMDTGSTQTLMTTRLAKRADVDTDTPGVELSPSDPKEFRYRFKSLSVKGVSIDNPLIYVYRDLMEERFRKEHPEKQRNDPIYGIKLTPSPVILGLNVIRKLHVYISYKEEKLYITAADAH